MVRYLNNVITKNTDLNVWYSLELTHKSRPIFTADNELIPEIMVKLNFKLQFYRQKNANIHADCGMCRRDTTEVVIQMCDFAD